MIPPNQAPDDYCTSQLQAAENAALTLSSANRILVADPDAKDSIEQVTLTATDGVLSLNNMNSLSGASGNNTGQVMLQGTIAALNSVHCWDEIHSQRWLRG